MTFNNPSGNKKAAAALSGKITVKKGLGKGAYKVKGKVSVAVNSNYNAFSKVATLKIRVK